MQRFRLLGIMFLAIFALGAVASATASAEEIGILPTPVKFSIEGDKEAALRLETTKGNKITCEKLKTNTEGEFKTDLKGEVTLDFEGCTSGGAKCNTAGDEGGKLLFPLLIGAVAIGLNIKMESQLNPGVTVELDSVLKITCGVLKIEVQGRAVGGVYKTLAGASFKSLEKFKEAFIIFGQKAGEQLFTTCELDATLCSGKTFKLEANFGNGFELAAEEAEAVIKFEKAKEVELHF